MNGAQHRGVFDTIFSQGFRPLFFGAGLGAAIAVAIWLSVLDLSFWAILFALVVREIVAARIWRHAPAIRPALATS